MSRSKRAPVLSVGANLEPNGFLVDTGLRKIQESLPEPTKEQLLEARRPALDYNHSLGITSRFDPLAEESVLETYRQLAERGELTGQVVACP
jgi:predicted amidohydrolase YtcJ